MSYKLRLADVLRYIILGMLTMMLCAYTCSILCPSFFADEVHDMSFYLFLKDNEKALSVLTPIFILICCYILGICIQSIIKIIYGDVFCGISIKEECSFLKNRPNLSISGVPDWIYWTDKPDIVIQEITEQTEIKLNSDSKSEYFLLNKLFQGLFFVSYILLFLSLFVGCEIVLGKIAIATLFLISFRLSKRLNFTLGVKNKTIVIVSIFAFLLLCSNVDNFLFDFFLLVVCAISWLIAKHFARKHIVSINSISITDRDALNMLLSELGVPTMYILIRTNSGKYLSETLDSIVKQSYPNIKVVILEDAVVKDENSSMSINSIVKDYEKQLDVLYYKSSSSGTYKLAVEIRKIFLNYAEDEDYAMILDSDDYFSSPNVVSDVVTQMCKKKANMCLVGFEIFGKQDLNYAKNYHNGLVKRIANLDSYIQFVDYDKREFKEISDDLYLASTLGWTKCYQKPVLQKYQALYEGYDKPTEYEKLSKYEDFLDQLTLMFKDAKITALSHPCYRFRKEEGSVTTKVSSDNYKVQIIGFLSFAESLYKNSKEGCYTEKSKDYIFNRYVVYKFIQYLDTIYNLVEKGRLEDYTTDNFYNDFIDKFKGTYDKKSIDSAIKEECKVIHKKHIFDISRSMKKWMD